MKGGDVDEIWQTKRLHQAIARLEMAKLKILAALEKGPHPEIVDERVLREAAALLIQLGLAQNYLEGAAHDVKRSVESVAEWLKS